MDDSFTLSPVGVGTGPQTLPELWDSIPDFSDIDFPSVSFPTEPVVSPPVGQGSHLLDYDKRDDVITAVSTVPFLPQGKNREALIQQFNITREEVDAAREAHNAALVRQGNPPVSRFPTIIWPRVNRPPVPSRRRGPGTGTTTSTTTRPTATSTPSTRARASTSTVTRQTTVTSTGGPSPRQQGMHDRLDQLTQQVHRDAQGRRIRNITHTNTVTTVYEEPQGGQNPTVRRTSTRTGAGRRTRRSNQTSRRQ